MTVKKELSFELNVPVKYKETDVTTISIRRPRVEDLLAMDNVTGGVAKTMTLISNLGMVAPEVVKNLDSLDFYLIQKEMDKHFFGQ